MKRFPQSDTTRQLLPSGREAAPPGVMVATMMVAAALLLSGCGQPTNADTPPGSSSSNAVPSGAVVDLSSNQLNAIKIGPVETYLFPVEKQEVGGIGFEEDPATVQAESTLLGAAATFTLTSNVLARAQALYGTNGVSKAELEQDVSAAETAEAALKAARAAVRALGETDDDIDQMIAAGKVGSVLDTSGPAKWVVANVLESDSPLIQTGQPVKVNVMVFPDHRFAGKVSKIYATVDPNLHRLAVRCEVDDPKDELRPGMLANVAIQVSEPVVAIAIPANGVVREGDGTLTAWVTTDRQRFTQRIIKTGLREDGEVQLLDGLQRGELVVTDGAIFLDNMLQASPSD